MTRLSGFILNQGKLVLENNRQALMHAVILALLPYTTWLSVAIVALVTLRKGGRDSRLLLVSAMMAYFALSLVSMSATLATVNTFVVFVPCYLAAQVLRVSASWRAVAGVFFLQLVTAVVLIQMLLPDFVLAQYSYIQTALSNMQTDSALLGFANDTSGLNRVMLANYLLGVQAVGVVLSAIFSLMLARSVQSHLYYPGGFRHELLSLRGDIAGLLLLIIMLFAANQGNVLAMSILPAVLLYFLLAGLSLGLKILAMKNMLGSTLLLVTPLLLLPFIMLPVYVIFGSLDSLFNFRLYLPTGVGKRT